MKAAKRSGLWWLLPIRHELSAGFSDCKDYQRAERCIRRMVKLC